MKVATSPVCGKGKLGPVGVWQAFQVLERRLRPKFFYGARGMVENLREAGEHYKTIRRACMEVLE